MPIDNLLGGREVEKLAGLHSIFLRTGCFCNPGACARHLGLTASQLKQNYEAGHVCWDDNDIIDGRSGSAQSSLFLNPRPYPKDRIHGRIGSA